MCPSCSRPARTWLHRSPAIRVYKITNTDLSAVLRERLQAVPYFSQLVLLDAGSGAVLASYPPEPAFQITRQEQDGLALVGQGVQNQIYTVPPVVEGEAAGASFLAALPSTPTTQAGPRVLIGRTYLSANPYTSSLINNLNSLASIQGSGMLIADGMVVYDSRSTQNWTAYQGRHSDQPAFFDQTASRGTRQLVYYQPVAGYPWAVALTIPAQETQQLAIDIAFPISLMIILLGLAALISLRVNLRSVTRSLQSLAGEAKHLATGKLDRPLNVKGEDEVGQLGASFEQMRVSLQARLQELNRLLMASQGVASSLTLGRCAASRARSHCCQRRQFGQHHA